MPNNINNEDSAFVKDTELYGKKIVSVPKPAKNIGIDTDENLISDLAVAQTSQINYGELDKFTSISDDRNQLYSLIDQMGADGIIARALEIYSSNSTEKNPQGRIVWAESNDSTTTKYITYLLDSLNIDKNIYRWLYSLVKYGDLYIHLYRESEVQDDLFNPEEKQPLNEDIKVKVFSKNDKFIHYVEAVPNPAEMFELTKFGKSYAYIQAPSAFAADYNYVGEEAWLTNAQNKYLYRFKRKDVTVYPATEFVHACLENTTNRFPETVEIFKTDTDYENNETDLSYQVRRGKSILADIYKIWRELKLLETSVLLNRVTKSSIVRTIQVEIGDMPKDRVEPHLRGVKSLIEQRSAIEVGTRMTEYTDPGPIENNVYIPTRNGQGAITVGQIGGDVDVKSLADLDYFRDQLFGALRIPKQYMGFTDDAAGFNGGTSLSLISADFAKMIKRLQTTMTQAITDIINLLLIDKKQTQYINKFSIHMLEPMTEEDKNRQENMSSEIQLTSDVMSLVGDIDDPIVKFKMLKAMLANTITNSEVLDLLQQQIDKLEADAEEAAGEGDESGDDLDMDFGDEDLSMGDESGGESSDLNQMALGGSSEQPSEGGSEELPNMNDLGMNFADSTQF